MNMGLDAIGRKLSMLMPMSVMSLFFVYETGRCLISFARIHVSLYKHAVPCCTCLLLPGCFTGCLSVRCALPCVGMTRQSDTDAIQKLCFCVDISHGDMLL